jgi:hypothetical protein
MYRALDFEENKIMLQHQGRKFAKFEDLLDEPKAEWHNLIFFASDAVLIDFYAFFYNPHKAF